MKNQFPNIVIEVAYTAFYLVSVDSNLRVQEAGEDNICFALRVEPLLFLR